MTFCLDVVSNIVQKTEQTEPFGFIVQRKRESMGLNQSELARLAGVSRSYISQLESIRKLKDGSTPQSPSEEISDALAEALGESKDYFRRLNGHPVSDDEGLEDPVFAELTSSLVRFRLLDDDDREFVLRQAKTTVEFLLEKTGAEPEKKSPPAKILHKDPRSIPGITLEEAKRRSKKK